MRWRSWSLALLAVIATSGCGPYTDLRDMVETLAPVNSTIVAKCQEFGAYVIDTPSYGCAYFAPGTRRGVALALARDLGRERFDSVCREDRLDGTIEFQAFRADMIVYARVSDTGSLITISADGDQALNIRKDTRFISVQQYRRAPRGNVIVKISAGEHQDGEARPAWDPCVGYVRGLRR
jgi:hypothetical protein